MRRLILLLLAVLTALPAAAFEFPRPPELEPAIGFWRDIFTKYSETQTVLHHRDHVTVIYEVLDFSDVAPVLDRDELRLHMRKVEKEQKAKLEARLLTLADDPAAADHDPALAHLRDVLASVPGPDKYRRAADRLRGQRGIRERFERAIMRSGRYLPYMEAVFAEAGLPILLTRLPLVESSFNEKAYSKSGAAGVWQFMPASARVYMQYDEVADDRRDPWIATRGAAAHLADDFELLQRWPLAVTAYNYGRYGIARGLESTGATSLVELIEEFDAPRWGFAAKNFYAEFLAAVEVEQNAVKYFGPLRRDVPEEFEEVETQHYVRYETLQRLAAADLQEFSRLNPRYSRAVQKGQLYVPPGQRVRLPVGHAPKFRQAYARLGPGEVFSEQKFYYRQHRVRSGETLSGIAQRYGSSMRAIMAANGLNKRHFIRIGQVLKVPPASGRGRDFAQGPSHHRVRPGETLSGIARRYRVSSRELQAINNIDRPQALRAGARLTLPDDAEPVQVAWHKVRSGQTVETIARRYGVSIDALARENQLSNVHLIRAGQKLRLPTR